MAESYKELIEYLNERFGKIDERFEKVDERFGKIDERFEKVDERFGKIDERFEKVDEKFERIDERFDKIDEKFGKLFEIFATKEDLIEAVKNLSTKEDFNKLLNAVDTYAKKADTYFQEMVMLAHKVDRHEKWIRQIAEKLGIKLEY
jgi:uncharacterized coiled-coil DUF342 family protein